VLSKAVLVHGTLFYCPIMRISIYSVYLSYLSL